MPLFEFMCVFVWFRPIGEGAVSFSCKDIYVLHAWVGKVSITFAVNMMPDEYAQMCTDAVAM